MSLPVVKVKKDNAKGYTHINEADFNPDMHVRVADDAASAPAPTSLIEDALTAEALDGMDKDALTALMDEREIEYDGRLGEDKLRETAKAALFPED